jgi:hypothetical protein
MPQNLLHHPVVINDRDNAHGILADRAAQRIHVPDPKDEVAPLPGRRYRLKRAAMSPTCNLQLSTRVTFNLQPPCNLRPWDPETLITR